MTIYSSSVDEEEPFVYITKMRF